MSSRPFPYLSPDPRFVFETKRKDWDHEDAKVFLEWALSRMESRTEAFLAFLGEKFDADPLKLFSRLQPKMEQLLSADVFRGERDMGDYIGSEHLEVFAFDLGLMLCRSVLRVADPVFRATVLRKPKTDMYYNKLVIMPTDNRWDRARWSPEHVATVLCCGMINDDQKTNACTVLSQVLPEVI